MLAEQIKSPCAWWGEGLRGQAPFIATIFLPPSMAKHLAWATTLCSATAPQPRRLYIGAGNDDREHSGFIEMGVATGIDGIYYASTPSAAEPDEFDAFGWAYESAPLASRRFVVRRFVVQRRPPARQVGYVHFKVADYPMAFNWHDRDTGISLAGAQPIMRPAASGGVSQWTLHQEAGGGAERDTGRTGANGDRRLLLGTGCVIMTTTPCAIFARCGRRFNSRNERKYKPQMTQMKNIDLEIPCFNL